jgi:F1F0 ATPase subunit 2
MADAAAGWLVPALAGALLAVAYLAGLWWTVQRVVHARHPVALVAVSFVVRTALVVGGLWLIMDGSVMRLLPALGGFLAVRAAVLWRVRAGAHAPHAGAERG